MLPKFEKKKKPVDKFLISKLENRVDREQ